MPINKAAIRNAREKETLALKAPRFDDVLQEVRSEHAKSVAKAATLRKLADKLASTIHSCRATLGVEHTTNVLAKYGRQIPHQEPASKIKLAELPSPEEARKDLADLINNDMFTTRYCVRSGVMLGQVSDIVASQLGALLQNEEVALSWLGTFHGPHLLAFHGLSPLWVRTDDKALMMLRRIDPAGYVTYLAHCWGAGSTTAVNLVELESRVLMREKLANDSELPDKIALLEICAKSGFKTGEQKTLQAMRDGCTFEELRNLMAEWFSTELESLTAQGDQIDGTLAALARSRIANHGYKALGIPRNIALLQRAAERRTIASVTLQDQYDIAAILGGAGYDVPPLALTQIAHTEEAARKLDAEQQRALADMFGSWDVAENYEIRISLEEEDEPDIFDGFALLDGDDNSAISDEEFMLWAEVAEDAEKELTSQRKQIMASRQTEKDEETLSLHHGDIFSEIDLGIFNA